jgi:rhamnosyltransferase
MPKTFAVIVAYHPDLAELKQLSASLCASGVDVVVVDNTEPAPASPPDQFGAGTWIVMGCNVGIARAQNVGVATAIAKGAEVIVFFDQDSKPSPDFIPKLLAGLDARRPNVVAPVCIDERTGRELPSYTVNRWGRPRKVFAGAATAPQDVDLVISSGVAASVTTFSVGGTMSEHLFIDYVDFDWCFKCRAKGIPIKIVPQARMMHSIGIDAVEFGFFNSVRHSAARTYYKVRNPFLLFRQPHVPFIYALQEALAALVSQFALLLRPGSRRDLAAHILRGVRDGIFGVTGRDPASRLRQGV